MLRRELFFPPVRVTLPGGGFLNGTLRGWFFLRRSLFVLQFHDEPHVRLGFHGAPPNGPATASKESEHQEKAGQRGQDKQIHGIRVLCMHPKLRTLHESGKKEKGGHGHGTLRFQIKDEPHWDHAGEAKAMIGKKGLRLRADTVCQQGDASEVFVACKVDGVF